jgi:hypothetical protein
MMSERILRIPVHELRTVRILWNLWHPQDRRTED